MKFEVLGCGGGESPEFRPVSFLIDETVLLEAGSAASTLSLERQARLEHALVSHSHLDHVKDLAFIAETRFLAGGRGLRIHGSASCLEDLRRSLFNDVLWPDFTRIPDPGDPVIRLEPVPEAGPLTLGNLRVFAEPVNHPGGAVGFLCDSGSGTLAYSGDTGNTSGFWRRLTEVRNLSALVLETSFPDDLESVAEVSGHLTPSRLARGLEMAGLGDVPVFVSSIKPSLREQVLRELAALGDSRIRVLEPGMILEF